MPEGPSTHPKFWGAAFSRVSDADLAVLLRPLVVIIIIPDMNIAASSLKR